MQGYRVQLNYDVFIGVKAVNQFMRDCNMFSAKEGVGQHRTVSITANFAKVPTNKDDLKTIGETFMNEFNQSKKNDLEILSCKFEGYGEINEIELQFEEKSNEEKIQEEIK